ncbi:MAG: CPBP family intramembrane metalloprotease [Planctomycetaceae bacterium]|nr:CPBP family intramembrane metalloprotease [Planctomycetaceae bacterium]
MPDQDASSLPPPDRSPRAAQPADEPLRPAANAPESAGVLPWSGAVPDEAPIVVAELVEDPYPLWPTFLTIVLAIGGAVLVSGIVMMVAAFWARGPVLFQRPGAFNAWFKEFVTTQGGLVLLVLPGQLTFCAVAVMAASLSREKVVDRLGLRCGNFPPWTWPLFLLGTPVLVIAVGQLLSYVVREPSEQLKMLEDLFATHAAGSLITMLLLISLLPGVMEELLFRGFMQRRLLGRLRPVAAIGITTAFFAAAHMDPTHAIGVAPLGIWLGVVAWRADSIWPAVFGHVGNNACAILMSVTMGEQPDLEQLSPAVATSMELTLLVSCLSFVGCLVLLSRRTAPPVSVRPID